MYMYCTASCLPIHTHTLLLLRCLPSFSITRSSSFSARVLPPNFCGGLSSPIPYRRRKEGWVRQISSAPPNRRRADKRTEERSQVKSQKGSRRKGVTHTHTLFSSFACKWPTHTQQTDRKRKAPHIHLPPLSQTGRGFFVNITISKMAVFLSEI